MTVVFNQSSTLAGTDDGDFIDNFNFRIVLLSSGLSAASGTQCKLEFRFGTLCPTSSNAIGGVWFGQSGASDPNFTGDQVQVTFSGNATSSSSGASVVVSDTFTLSQSFDNTKKYTCSFYVNASVSIGISLAKSSAATMPTTEWDDVALNNFDNSGATVPSNMFQSGSYNLRWLEQITITSAAGTSIGWLNPLAEPVRPKPLPASARQFTAFSPNFTIPSHGWFEPLSEPARPKPWISPSQQQVQAYAINFSIPNFGWYVALKEVPRPLVRIFRVDQPFVPFVSPTAPSFGWFASLSEPPKAKPLLPAAQQQAVAYAVNFTIPSFGWFKPLIEPSRKFAPLPLGAGQGIVLPANFSIPSFGWFEPLAQPVRLPPQSLEKTFFALPPLPIVPSFAWYEAFSEPPRQQRLPASVLQQSLIYAPFTAPAAPSFAWFAALAEPVRYPVGLPATLRMSVHAWPIAPVISVSFATLSATELGDLMQMALRGYNVPIAVQIGVSQKSS